MQQHKDQQLEALLNKYPHVGVTIIHTTKDEIDYLQVFGKKDLNSCEPLTNNSIFRIASISKVIVALGIMKLVEDGKLDIYEDVSKYLGFPLRNIYYPDDKITLEMIMTQTSSLNDGNDDPHLGYDGVNGPTMEVDLNRLLNDETYEYYTKKTYLNKKPGTYWNYSNFGCGILACIIEKVTGKYFTDYIKEVLLDPLGIDGGYRIEQVKKMNDVVSLYDYSFKDNKFILLRNKDLFLEKMFPKYPLGNNFRGPAGGLFISGTDLSKIMLMLMNKGKYQSFRYLKEETVALMEQIHWQGIASDEAYKAKGLQLLLLDGFSKETLKGHFGFAYGLRSFMLYNTNHGYIFLCNGADYKEYEHGIVKMERDILEYLVNKFEK
jgi:CubicO group peptidase (beta-lactamase class C family)